MTIFSVTVICFKGSEEEGGTALYQSLQKVPIVRSNILMTSFIDYVLFKGLDS